MVFGDWRTRDQTPISMKFARSYIYYLHSRAWAAKGYLGGTHSWFVFWSTEHGRWLVVELTDMETIDVQNAKLIFVRDSVGYYERTPIISDRIPDSRWFGSNPKIIGCTKSSLGFDDIKQACINYPIKDFNVLTRNCNTFSSYMIHACKLPFRRPFRSIGFRDSFFWQTEVAHDNTKYI